MNYSGTLHRSTPVSEGYKRPFSHILFRKHFKKVREKKKKKVVYKKNKKMQYMKNMTAM